jgi:flagellar hook protein FlgE
MNSGVSGLRNHQVRIDVLGNNISNVNTIGYKNQRVNFQNQFSQTLRGGAAPSGNLGGTNPSQVGLGMTVGSIDLQMSQGALQITGKATDLAISGEGFFVLNDGVQNIYTRDGQFDFDKQGNLVKTSNGFRVLGWNAQEVNGVPTINSSRPPEPITVPKSTSIPPQATDMLKFGGNLSSNAAIPTFTASGNLDSATAIGTAVPGPALTMIDSAGNTVQGDLTYTKTAADTWAVTFTPGAGLNGAGTPQPLGTVTFDASTGSVLSYVPASPATLTLAPTAANAQGIEFAFDAGTLMQRANPSTVGGATSPVTQKEVAVSTKMFDSLGNERSGTMIFTRQSTGAWTARFEHGGGFSQPSPIYLSGSVTFDSRGVLSANTLQTLSLNPDLGASPMQISLDVGKPGQALGFTQFANPNSAVLADQNGYAAGELAAVSLDSSGTVTGSFTNGRTRILAQVAVANFTNPAGMASAGDNSYIQSNNSGEAQIGIAGNGGRGTLQSGALEGSNVDLAQTFSDLIVAQRGFQSNSRIISTSDEVLQELMSLKR